MTFTIKYIGGGTLQIQLDAAFGNARHQTYRDLEEHFEGIDGVEAASFQRYSGWVQAATHVVQMDDVARDVALILRAYGEVDVDLHAIRVLAAEER